MKLATNHKSRAVALVLFFALFTTTINAQTGMGVGTSTPAEKLDVNGAVKIGTTSSTNAGTIRWTGTQFQGYDGSSWLNFGGSGGWLLNGNVGTTPGTDFIGTTDNVALRFKTNNLDRMTIYSNGNIGIGTTAPVNTLEVVGPDMTLRQPNNFAGAIFSIRGNRHNGAGSGTPWNYSTTGFASIDMKNYDASDGNVEYIGARILATNGESSDDGDLRFYTTSDQVLTEAMRIDYLGNVGIGAKPAEKLHVAGNIRMVDGNQQAGYVPVSDANGTMTWTDPATLNDGDWTINGSDIYNANAGNVGIGVNSPVEKLAVWNGDFIIGGNQNIVSRGMTIYGARQGTTNPAWDVGGIGHAFIKFDNYDGNTSATRYTGAMISSVNYPASDDGDLRFYTGSDMVITEAMRIDYLGNVGIGGTPTEKLQVQGSIKMVDGNQAAGYIPVSDANGKMTWTDPTTISDGDWTTSGNNIYNVNTDNVGIGTTNPQEKLHVVGSARIQAGRLDFRGTGNSVFVGQSAGSNDDFSNNENVYVGYNAGAVNITGIHNTAVGAGALESSTSSSNTAIGWDAMSSATTANNSTALGHGSLGSMETGDSNVGLGSLTLLANTSGSDNTAVGLRAGQNNLGSGNVFIGHRAGQNETGSNTLYIDNSNTTTPLIHGNFQTNEVGIWGNLGIGTNDPSRPLQVEGISYFNGSVGIGTSNPESELNVHVNTNGLNYPLVLRNLDGTSSGGNAVGIGFTNNGTLGAAPKGMLVHERTGGFGRGSFHFLMNESNNGSAATLSDAKVTITSNGNLGVGTTTPADELEVVGSIRMVDGNQAAGYVPVSNANGTMTWTDPTTLTTADDGDWTISGNDQYSTPSGNVGIGTTAPGQKFHLAGGRALFSGTSSINSGIELIPNTLTTNNGGRVFFREDNATDNFGFSLGYNGGNSGNEILNWPANAFVIAGHNSSASGTVHMVIQRSTGNMGVGTITPGQKLDVDGKIQMRTGATTGYIPVSDANGTMTWTDPTTLTTADDGDWTVSGNNIYNSNTGSVGIGTTNPNRLLTVGNALSINVNPKVTINSDGNQPLLVGGNTNNKAVMIGYDGNDIQGRTGANLITNGDLLLNRFGGSVGVGTTTPGAKFHVQGTTNLIDKVTVSNPVAISVVPMMTVNSDGNRPLVVGENTNNKAVMIGHDGNDIQGRTGANLITNGDLLLNRYGGNVGVGTTTPGQKLDVNGKIQMRAGATAGYVPVSDANGTMTWTDPTTLTTADDGDWTISGNDQYSTPSGNVGIGTTSPVNKLHVEGTTHMTDNVTINVASTSGKGITFRDGYEGRYHVGLNVYDHSGSGAGFADGLAVSGYDGISLITGVTSSTYGNVRMLITQGGSVGIGTSAPNDLLHVEGKTHISDNLTVDAGGVSGKGITLRDGYDGRYHVGLNAYDHSGSGTSFADGLAVSGYDGISFITGVTSSTYGNVRMLISQAGNVGIGTTTPADELEVAGSVRMVDGNQAAGYIPVSDANGTMTWTDPTTITTADDGDWLENGTHIYNGNTGNVGVGSASPGYKLDVDGTFGASGGGTFGNNVQITGNYYLDNTNGTGTNNPPFRIDGFADKLYVIAESNSNGPATGTEIRFRTATSNNSASDRMTINNTGNVGIGTATPTEKLDVRGDVFVDAGATSKITIAGNRNGGNVAYNSTSGIGHARLDFENDDTGTIYTAARIESINRPGNNSGDLRFYTTDNTTLQEAMNISNVGNVGIGTIGAEKLHVEGSIRMVDGNQAAGYVPVSDANGTMTWTDPTTIATADDGDWLENGTHIYNGNTGNVGIGTTAPTSALHVLPSNNNGPTVTIETGSNQYPSSLRVIPTTHVTSQRANIEVGSWGLLQDITGNGTEDFAIYNGNTGSQSISISATDNVGIGTFAPQNKLQVIGEANIGTSNTLTGIKSLAVGNSHNVSGSHTLVAGNNHTVAGNYSVVLNNTNSNTAAATTSITGGFQSHTSANLGMAIGWADTSSAVTAAAFGRGNNARSFGEFVVGTFSTAYTPVNTNGFNSADRVFTVGNGSAAGSRSDAMVILKNANTGIGTSTPGQRLDVNGQIQMRTGATAGYIPVSDANGTMTWTDPTTISTAEDGDWLTNGTHLYNGNTGNIGIGTSTPGQRLEVRGATNGVAVIKVDQLGTDQYAGNLIARDGTEKWFVGMNNIDDDFIIRTNASFDAVTVNNTSGNVGIGLTAPVNKLSIYGTSSDTQAILGLQSGNTSTGFNNGAQIAFSYNGTDDYQHFIHTRHNAANSNNAIDFYVSDGTQNNTLTSGSVHTMSLNSGNVGIATTTPVSALNVYEPDESTTQTNFTQALGNSGMLITSQYTANAYMPGLFWNTTNNNATKPKGGVYLRETSTGTQMYLGTSNNYTIGVTNNVIIEEDGDVNIGSSGIIFTDPENGGATVELRGSDGAYPDDGIAIRTLTNPANGEPIFRVISSGGAERLRVEHSGATSIDNNLTVTGTATINGGGPSAGAVLKSTDGNGLATWESTSSRVVYTKSTGNTTYAHDAWQNVTGWTSYLPVNSNDILNVTAFFMDRLTGGSGNDDFSYRVEYEGCASGYTNNVDGHRPDEDGSNHDNFKPVTYFDVLDVNCNGQLRFRLQVYNSGDDNFEIKDRVLSVSKY